MAGRAAEAKNVSRSMNAAADIPAASLLWYENGSDRGAIFILSGDPWVMRVFFSELMPKPSMIMIAMGFISEEPSAGQLY